MEQIKWFVILTWVVWYSCWGITCFVAPPFGPFGGPASKFVVYVLGACSPLEVNEFLVQTLTKLDPKILETHARSALSGVITALLVVDLLLMGNPLAGIPRSVVHSPIGQTALLSDGQTVLLAEPTSFHNTISILHCWLHNKLRVRASNPSESKRCL